MHECRWSILPGWKELFAKHEPVISWTRLCAGFLIGPTAGAGVTKIQRV